jgi:hypothetical protein
LPIRNELERLLHPNEKDVFVVNQKALSEYKAAQQRLIILEISNIMSEGVKG